MCDYRIGATLRVGFAETADATRAALAYQGFGIVTEIHVAATGISGLAPVADQARTRLTAAMNALSGPPAGAVA